MRDAIARALTWALNLLFPATGRRRAGAYPEVVSEPAVPENPWLMPWTTPTKEEAAEIFRERAACAAALARERRVAAVLATRGVDYPYSYPGAPFPAAVFQTGMAA